MNKEKVVSELMSGYRAAKEYCKPLWEQRKRNLDLYVGKKPKKKYKSEANFHVPYVATLLENVHPLLTSRLPVSKVVARNFDRDEKSSILMQNLLGFTFSVNSFDMIFLQTEKESMFYGDGWNKVCWSPDPEKNYALIKKLNSNDVRPHPNKLEMDDNWPIYHTREMTKAEMREEGWDKRAISALGKSKLGDSSYRKKQLEMMGMGHLFTDENPRDDLYEVVEVWGKMDLSFGKDEEALLQMGYIVIANETTILNNEPLPGLLPYQSPYAGEMMPFAKLPYNLLPNIFLGESFIDPLADMQIELNALENMKADNYKRRNNPPMKVRRRGDVDLSTLKFVTATPWLVNELEDIEPFVLPDLAPSIDAQQAMVRRTMENRSGANDILLANTESRGERTSATEANIANENTKMRFRTQAVYIDLYVERIGKLLINLYQDPRYFTQEMALSIADEEGKYYQELVSNDNVQGDLQFTVDSASSIAQSDQAILTQAVQIKELYLDDQSVDQDEFDKVIIPKAGFDFNKVKRSKDSMASDAAMKLQQLVNLTQRPEFQNQPEAKKQQVYASIEKLKAIVEQSAGKMNNKGMPTPGNPNSDESVSAPVAGPPNQPIGGPQPNAQTLQGRGVMGQ